MKFPLLPLCSIAMLGTSFPADGWAQRPVRTITGTLSDAKFGTAIASLGDVNGDGIPDLAIGAPMGQPTLSNAGSVEVRSGSDSSFLGSISGIQNNGQLGRTVVALGDINGDGVGDFAAGAPFEEVGTTISGGNVRMVSGASVSLVQTISGLGQSTFLGETLVTIDDVDGDGLRDLLALASGSSSMGRAARVVLYSSATGLELREHVATVAELPPVLIGLGDLNGDGTGEYAFAPVGPVGLQIRSGSTGAIVHDVPRIGNRYPRAGASLGDLSGDGIDEFAVTWLGPGTPTVVLVYDGSNFSVLQTLEPEHVADSFGFALAGGGDFDGDGVPDLAVGTPGLGGPQADTGRAQVFSGSTFGELARVEEFTVPLAKLGTAVAFAGDIDGIAGDELAIGVPNGASFRGEVRIIGYDTGVGSSICSPAVPNSTGTPATLRAFGSDVLAEGNLTLNAHGLPLGTFALGLTATATGFVPNLAGTDGTLCLGGSIGRIGGAVQANGSGSLQIPLDLQALPTALGPTAVIVGDRWFFQIWYRDLNPTATANLTDTIEIVFQ